jgi:hypothetical protein
MGYRNPKAAINALASAVGSLEERSCAASGNADQRTWVGDTSNPHTKRLRVMEYRRTDDSGRHAAQSCVTEYPSGTLHYCIIVWRRGPLMMANKRCPKG